MSEVIVKSRIQKETLFFPVRDKFNLVVDLNNVTNGLSAYGTTVIPQVPQAGAAKIEMTAWNGCMSGVIFETNSTFVL